MKLDRKAFRRARKMAGLTQIELGQALGKGHNWASRIERGERDIALSDYVAVCKLLRIPMEQCITTDA